MQIVSFLSTRVPRLRQIFLPFICGILIAGAVIPSLTTAQSGKKDEIYRQLGLFGDIFQRVRESYVDEVNEKDLVEAAPSIVKEAVPEAEANEIKGKLEEAGATVEVK